MEIYSLFIYLTTALTMVSMACMFSTTSRNIKISNVQVILMTSMIAIIFAIIFGMRWNVGIDNLEYLDIYRTNNTSGYETEYIFKFINDSLYKNHVHYAIYFGLIAFLQIFLLIYSFKDERFLWPFIIIALFGGHFFWDWMNVIRQETASCIGFWAITYIVHRNPWKYLFCVIIAFGFHKSAVLLLPIYPLVVSGRNLTPARWLQFIFILIPSALAFLHFDILNKVFPILDTLQEFEALSDYNRYGQNVLQSYSDRTKIGYLFVIFLAVNIFIVLYSKKLKNFFYSKRFRIYYNLYFWGTVCELFVATNMVLARPFRYFRIYKLVMIALLLYYLYKSKNKYNYIVFFLILGLMLAGVVLISIQSPFNFYFEIPYAP